VKISTWNVNGYRAALSKGLLEWVNNSSPDILCLQEIKVRPDQLNDEQRSFPGYEAIWNSALRLGYSGVATFLRRSPIESRLGLGDDRFDQEGRVIRTRHPGFWLYNIYFPNGQHDLGRVPYKLEFYALLLAECDRMHAAGEKIILTGDFNTAHNEIDLAHPRDNQNTSGFLPEEREWVSRYLEHGFVDAFRYLYPQKVQYTWWTYRLKARSKNIGWRLDYFLISQDYMPAVQDVIIHDLIQGSDHCPVTLVLDTQ
jgi:exodeoxyribonuclease-3